MLRKFILVSGVILGFVFNAWGFVKIMYKDTVLFGFPLLCTFADGKLFNHCNAVLSKDYKKAYPDGYSARSGRSFRFDPA